MKKLLAVILLSLTLSGCGAKLNHPNAVNQIDDKAYDAILSAQAALDDARPHMGEHPEAKELFNQAAAALNTVEPIYKAYHTSAAKDPAAAEELQDALNGLAANIVSLEHAFERKLGGK